MGTLYDPVESDLASYQMTFILSPELWEKFNSEGINVDYSKWARVKMMDLRGCCNRGHHENHCYRYSLCERNGMYH